MFFFIGLLVVIGSIMGGFMAHGGNVGVLWQPFEYVIIGGAAIGAFIIGNPKSVQGGVLKNFKKLLTGQKYKKDSYLEVLGALYAVFKLAKTKGDLALESHVEKPEESSLFQKFPTLAGDHHSIEFMCDYLRLLTLGVSTSHEVESVMDQELEIHHNEMHAISGSISNIGESLPALGIVAAVLGVINTMGSITEPPEVLGLLIGGALVGTFFGVAASYGVVSPIGRFLEQTFNSEAKYMLCIKTGIIAHMQGYAPQVSIEFARKVIDGNLRPTFAEVEEMIQNIPSE